MEMQRFLQNVMNNRGAIVDLADDFRIPEEMDFDTFVLTVHAMGIHWLNNDQLFLIFEFIDDDKSGLISKEEIL